MFFPAADTIAFAEGGAEAMRIDSAGNVGIGTVSPSSFGKFAVLGSGVPLINYGNGTVTGTAGYIVGSIAYSGSRSNHSIGFLTNDTERMRIDTSGNVGIGTSSPNAKLHVSADAAKIRIGITADSGYLDISRDNATGYSIYNAAQATPYRAHIWQLGGTEAMRIDTSGNVGIGNTPSGTYKLQVTGLISDTKGDVRAAPIQSKVSAYVLVAADAGQTISITTGGVTVNASVFSAGDMVSIFNNSGSSQNITQGAGVILRLTGTATTGTRALAQYGIATLLCVVGGGAPVFACTGSGLT
jgi:hypothetical protein